MITLCLQSGKLQKFFMYPIHYTYKLMEDCYCAPEFKLKILDYFKLPCMYLLMKYAVSLMVAVLGLNLNLGACSAMVFVNGLGPLKYPSAKILQRTIK